MFTKIKENVSMSIAENFINRYCVAPAFIFFLFLSSTLKNVDSKTDPFFI